MEKKNSDWKKKFIPSEEKVFKKIKAFVIAMLFFGCILACLIFTKNIWLILTISIILAVIIAAIAKE